MERARLHFATTGNYTKVNTVMKPNQPISDVAVLPSIYIGDWKYTITAKICTASQ